MPDTITQSTDDIVGGKLATLEDLKVSHDALVAMVGNGGSSNTTITRFMVRYKAGEVSSTRAPLVPEIFSWESSNSCITKKNNTTITIAPGAWFIFGSIRADKGFGADFKISAGINVNDSSAYYENLYIRSKAESAGATMYSANNATMVNIPIGYGDMTLSITAPAVPLTLIQGDAYICGIRLGDGIV